MADKAEPGTAIVSWKDKMALVTAQAVEAEKPVGGFISFKGGRMSYNDQLIPGDKLQCIIVDYILENSYFDTKYDPDTPKSPVCYAFGRKEKGMAPHEEAEAPQNDTCEDCPQNEWGSAGEGSKGKACKNTRRLAILHADFANTPDRIHDGDLVFAKLPVTSVRNFSAFVNQVAVLNVPPFGVVCEMSVVPDNKTLFQVHFKALKAIEGDDLLAALVAKNELASQKLIQVYPKNEEMQDKPKSNKY